MPMWLLSGAFFPVPAWDPAAGWGQLALSAVMRANPLTYSMAGLRRLLYAQSSHPPATIDLPSAWICWSVTIAFAVVMFALAWKIAAQRTTADLL
jgi:ABC-2 type transport system permease protein